MTDGKFVLDTLNTTEEFLKIILDLSDRGVLLNEAPEKFKEQFLNRLNVASWKCAEAIAILEVAAIRAARKKARGAEIH